MTMVIRIAVITRMAKMRCSCEKFWPNPANEQHWFVTNATTFKSHQVILLQFFMRSLVCIAFKEKRGSVSE